MTEPDPYQVPAASPRGRRALTVLAFVLAVLAIFQLPIVIGPLGMAVGLVAHVKGDRLGFVAAMVAGATTVIGMALLFFFDNPMR
jgi:hypothetical protein